MATAVATPKAEVDRVVSWRLTQLRHAGYPPREAALISKCVDVDLHRAVALMEHDCPVDVALRILL